MVVGLFGAVYDAFDLVGVGKTPAGLWGSLYYSLVTQATVGFGDILPSSLAGSGQNTVYVSVNGAAANSVTLTFQ